MAETVAQSKLYSPARARRGLILALDYFNEVGGFEGHVAFPRHRRTRAGSETRDGVVTKPFYLATGKGVRMVRIKERFDSVTSRDEVQVREVTSDFDDIHDPEWPGLRSLIRSTVERDEPKFWFGGLPIDLAVDLSLGPDECSEQYRLVQRIERVVHGAISACLVPPEASVINRPEPNYFDYIDLAPARRPPS